MQNTLSYKRRVDRFLLLLPPSMGRRGWVTHPASPSFLWKEVARSAGGWLRSFSPSANPLPIYPLPREGDRWATHPASPSFLWKEVARSAGGWLRSFSPSANPLPIYPLPREGDRWATHPASPSFLWKEVARSAGGWLRSFSPSANPRPSGIPLPWEGGRFLTASPAFLRKEEICYLNSLQRSSKTSWLGFST